MLEATHCSYILERKASSQLVARAEGFGCGSAESLKNTTWLVELEAQVKFGQGPVGGSHYTYRQLGKLMRDGDLLGQMI